MKSVLISIQPKWCELIASGKKTVEVRKTKPKLETPFKAYIYCTQAKKPVFDDISERIVMYEDDLALTNRWGQGKCVQNPCGMMLEGELFLNGRVIGEFVCDDIDTIAVFNDLLYCVNNSQANKLKQMCLTIEEIKAYLGSKNLGYNWHISDLVIYDNPRELSDFIVRSKTGCCNEGKCNGCPHLDSGNGFNIEDDCNAKFNTDEYKPLRRAPQSWCYVERISK